MAALRLRQLGVRGGDPRHGVLEVLRARRRRERARRGRLLVGALGDDLHGDRRVASPPARRDRRPRGRPEAVPCAPHLPLGGRDGPDGHGRAGRRPVGPRRWRSSARWASRPPSSTTTRTSPIWPTPRGGAGCPRTGSRLATRARPSRSPPRCPSRSEARYGGAFLTAAALFGLFALPAMLFLPPDRPGGLSARPGRCGSGSRRRARPSGRSSDSRTCEASSSPISSSRTASTPWCTSRRSSRDTPSASRPRR